MKVYAFIGPSGTGKSHRALVVAHEHNIECMIDDGILIHQNKIVAGFSAKKESSRLKAVRRAIFTDPKQISSVKEALERIKPEKLLILGTSLNMVVKITKAIGADEPCKVINIEEVATKEEIEKAQYARLKEGKHIIPVPTMELKPHFRGYLIDPIKSIFRRSNTKRTSNEWYEKSVVRPSFSYYGRLTFADNVILSLIKNGSQKVKGIVAISDVKIKKSKKGNNGLLLELAVTIKRKDSVKSLMSKLQKAISHEIEYITGMSIERIQITVKNIV